MKGEIHLDEFTVDTNEPVNDMQWDDICNFFTKAAWIWWDHSLLF